MRKKRVVVSYSGGKDSTLALHRLIHSNEWEIDSLFTTVNEDFKRSSIHGVRESLLDEQAESLGIPLRKVYIPSTCTNEQYENIMDQAVQGIISDGVTHIMFGDIFLADIKAYREKMLSNTPLKPVFPIWNEKPSELINEFLQLGYQTITTCIDGNQLDPSFVGRIVDETFLKDLPVKVDPCGENGEYHTFVFDGPIFSKRIIFEQSKDVTVSKDIYTGKDRFYFIDLIPRKG